MTGDNIAVLADGTEATAKGPPPYGDLLPGYVVFGDIHSHCDFGAFHSGTDDADERHGLGDGLHITIGRLGHISKDYSARWMLMGTAYPAKFETVVETDAAPAPRPTWLAQMKEEPPPIVAAGFQLQDGLAGRGAMGWAGYEFAELTRRRGSRNFTWR
jgi:hypothetical protein